MANSKRLIWAACLVMGILVTNAFAGEQPGLGTGKPSLWSNLIRNYVWSPKGELLGRVWDLVVDTHGQTMFVVISTTGVLGVHGKEVAVPFASFSYDQKKRRFVADIPRDKLFGAPSFATRSLYSEEWAEATYRYFGKAPYWTEGDLVEKGIKPSEDPKDYRGIYNPFDFGP